MIIKKGAMFGLDARIALAIFGALSVISGAALYSAIQQAKITQYITDMTELGKAYEAFLLDTGVELTRDNNGDGDPVFGRSGYLIENPTNIAGWNGPYISYEKYGSSNYLKHNETQDYIIVDFAEDKDWTSVTDNRASGAACVTANTTCWAWVRLQGNFNLSLMQAMDKEIDGDDSAWTGNFRYRYKSNNARQEAYLKYMPAFEQPNR